MEIPGLLESPLAGQWDAEKIATSWLQTGYSPVTRATHIKRLQAKGVSPGILSAAIQMADHAISAGTSAAKQQQAAAQAAQAQQFSNKLAGKMV